MSTHDPSTHSPPRHYDIAVPSRGRPGAWYRVLLVGAADGGASCTCRDHQYRARDCKHIAAVRAHLLAGIDWEVPVGHCPRCDLNRTNAARTLPSLLAGCARRCGAAGGWEVAVIRLANGIRVAPRRDAPAVRPVASTTAMAADLYGSGG